MTKTKNIPIRTMVDVPDKDYYSGEDFIEAKYLQVYHAMQLAWDRETLQMLDAHPEKLKAPAKWS